MQESEYIYHLSDQHKTHPSLQAFHQGPCPRGTQHQQQGGVLLAEGWHSTHTGSKARRQKNTFC